MIDVIIMILAIIFVILGLIKYVRDFKRKKSGLKSSSCIGCKFADNCLSHENKKSHDENKLKN